MPAFGLLTAVFSSFVAKRGAFAAAAGAGTGAGLTVIGLSYCFSILFSIKLIMFYK